MALKVDNARSKVVASKFTVIITISIVAAISNTASVPIRTADLNSRRRIRTDKPASMGSRAVGQLRRLPNRSYINHGVLGFKDGGNFLGLFCLVCLGRITSRARCEEYDGNFFLFSMVSDCFVCQNLMKELERRRF